MTKLYIVGTGPGRPEYLTLRAVEVLRKVEVVVGYGRYIEPVMHLIRGKIIYTTGMRDEVKRCLIALRESKKRDTALVCGGDPGIYGLAGLCLELNERLKIGADIEIVPGVTAALAAGALVGAPFMRDMVILNLSDLLVPWEEIEHKLIKALEGDFTIAIYNPISRNKRKNITRVLEIVREMRGNDVLIAVVKNAMREGQKIKIGKISEISPEDIDMNSIVIICSSKVRKVGKWLIAERGYSEKISKILTELKI
ncbi:MAG: precorrin-3B C(17)-methyltransferase [Crenarchaeota archaeon]|nr:precorrin-3B C(17)-methyltransferase [Thermoproteota archaeon]